MSRNPAILLGTLVLVACGSNDRGKPPAAPAAAPAANPAPSAISELERTRFTSETGVAIDPEVARWLPGDTAGALTVANLPALVEQLRLGGRTKIELNLGSQLRHHIGVNLLDAREARAAGIALDQPVTLAWLDPDGEELVLAVGLTKRGALTLVDERSVMFLGKHAFIPIGTRRYDVENALAKVVASSSLAGGGRLDRFARLRFGADAALYVATERYPELGGRAVVAGLTLEQDAVLVKVGVDFGEAAPPAAEWATRVAGTIGADPQHARGPRDHWLDRALAAEPGADRIRLSVTSALARATAGFYQPDVIETLRDLLGPLALGARPAPKAGLIYYGGIGFGAGKAPVVALAAAQLVPPSRRAFTTFTGTADFTSGLDDEDVPRVELEPGEMTGGFGTGTSGFGPGGGGTGWGTIGTGRYGNIGHGGGTGSGYGKGSGGMKGRKAVTPKVRIGNASVKGDLDKNIIRRYIRRNLRRIRYCYEKQLLVAPGLAGKVTVSFTIGRDGKVIQSTATGVAKEVSTCVADALRGVQFPKPKGGGIVIVSYPFVFKPK